jgi:hypothetical protein
MADTLSFWLIPTQETRAWFTHHIGRLAERFDAPVFEPHLTVHTGPIEGVASPASVLAETTFECEPITLRPLGLGHSSQFTITLFVELEQNQALLDLASKLRDRLPSDYILKPHISLLYHRLSEEDRERLLTEIEVPSDEVRFEVIQAVKCPAFDISADDVRSWQILEEWRL